MTEFFVWLSAKSTPIQKLLVKTKQFGETLTISGEWVHGKLYGKDWPAQLARLLKYQKLILPNSQNFIASYAQKPLFPFIFSNIPLSKIIKTKKLI